MAVEPSTRYLVKDGMTSAKYKHKFTWKIRCSDVLDTTWTVYTSASNPKKGSTPPAEVGSLPDGYVALDDGDVQPMDDSPRWFTITCEYGVPTTTTTELSNPLTIVQRYGGGSDLFRSVSRDLSDTLLTNSFGDYIDPLPVAPCNAGSFGMVIRTTNLPLYTTISHKVNQAAIWGFPARTLKIGRVSWRNGSESGVRFWEIDIPFDYNEETWDLKYENVGWRGYDSSGTLTAEHIVDARDNGAPSRLPMYLNASGQFVDLPLDPVDLPPLRVRKIYKEVNVAALSLPNPFTLT